LNPPVNLNLLSENMRVEIYINLFTARCGVKMFHDDGANEMSAMLISDFAIILLVKVLKTGAVFLQKCIKCI